LNFFMEMGEFLIMSYELKKVNLKL
jgi:hypothetical protein